ncbi:MAG: hypothetical protein KDJ16_02950 [Hyphomicrobiales bacterium]|nr:hypothetical protein [Hyphomicrobiales bacterium]
MLKRRTLLTGIVAGLASLQFVSAHARIRTMPLPELVAASELIAIVEVTAINDAPQGVDGARVRNVLRVSRVLKGRYAMTDALTIGTHYRPGEAAREDAVVFPAEGRRALLFLRQGPDKSWRLVNGIQGLWPLEPGADKTLGMGFRYSIAEVERLIATKP